MARCPLSLHCGVTARSATCGDYVSPSPSVLDQYDELTAAELVRLLPQVDIGTVRRVLERETATKARVTVIRRAEAIIARHAPAQAGVRVRRREPLRAASRSASLPRSNATCLLCGALLSEATKDAHTCGVPRRLEAPVTAVFAPPPATAAPPSVPPTGAWAPPPPYQHYGPTAARPPHPYAYMPPPQPRTPVPNANPYVRVDMSKPWYRRTWVIVTASVIGALTLIGALAPQQDGKTRAASSTREQSSSSDATNN